MILAGFFLTEHSFPHKYGLFVCDMPVLENITATRRDYFSSKIISLHLLWYFSLAVKFTGFEIKSSIGFFKEKWSQSTKVKAKQTLIVLFPTWGLPFLKVWVIMIGPFFLKGLVAGNCFFPWVKLTFKSHFKTDLKVSLKIKSIFLSLSPASSLSARRLQFSLRTPPAAVSNPNFTLVIP